MGLRILLIAAWLVAGLSGGGIADAQEAPRAAQLEANKEVVRRFFEAGTDSEKILELLHPDYIQHNPIFRRFGEINGVKGRQEFELLVGTFLEQLQDEARIEADPMPPPANPTYILMAENDLVTAIQQRYLPDPQNPGAFYEAFWFDAWRIKDGKLYEHWDAAVISNPPPRFLAGPALKPPQSR